MISSRQEIKNAGRVVVKVGTSTITHENGRLDLRRLSGLSRVICDLVNSGKEIVLVTSGAIGVGLGKLGLDPARPDDISKRQALASIGQCELMFIYDKLFGEYNHMVSQVLLTSDVIGNDLTRTNVVNTFSELLSMGVTPIVNENDTVATDELEGANIGDNDTLSAYVAELIDADLLILITDREGLYDGDPEDEGTSLIHEVREITDDIKKIAGEPSGSFGTGGMATKITAAEIAGRSGIACAIISGRDPGNLYSLFDGEETGTFFPMRNDQEAK